MRTIGKTVRTVVCGTALMLMALPGISAAAEPGGMGGMQHGDHAGMKMDGRGMQGQGMMHGGNDMMKMGTRVYQGKMGPWHGEARMIDMKAQMEASGMKAQGTMMNSHHIALALTDPKTKAAVTEGAGTVTVIGPDKSMATYNMTGMQGHFGADVNLPKPGKYTCNVKLDSGGKTGAATFHYTLK
ncbi:MAG: hypothetical protein ACYC24_04595 [Desulfobacteria bacterium]